MFTYKKPEEKGIKSENIKKYIEILEKSGLATHNMVIARGNDIVYENYWKPFNKDFLHRQYS
ncbi:MAG: serine hydrolase, partial [Clostridia bacterium]|nr:serine hydrolase [Clostridia bacterium]